MNARTSFAAWRVGSVTTQTSIFTAVFVGVTMLACPSLAVDTDGDGLLDLMDVPGFIRTATGNVSFEFSGIQDLDGANLLTKVQTLNLYGNKLTSLESGDFEGLTNLQKLSLAGNQITSLEPGAFEGLDKLPGLSLQNNQITSLERGAFKGLGNLLWLGLQHNQITSLEQGALEGLTNLGALYLNDNRLSRIDSGVFEGMGNLTYLALDDNQLSELNFARAEFESLGELAIDGDMFTRLILDEASLSRGSFDLITGATRSITEASLVGLSFSDERPADLGRLLDINSLAKVTVAPELFRWYIGEFLAFATTAGKLVDVLWPGGTVPSGDFDRDGQLTVADFDALTDAMTTTPNDPAFDLDLDGTVSYFDQAFWIRLLKRTYFGDANLDGEFNSTDFTQVFEAGEYEDAIEDNSGWAEGDWDGDGDFTSGDFVTAFLDGGYEQGPRPAAAVPEPSALGVLLVGWLLLVRRVRRSYKALC